MDPASFGLMTLMLLLGGIGYGHSKVKKREQEAAAMPQPTQMPIPSPSATPDSLAAYTRGTVPPQYQQDVRSKGDEYGVPPALLAGGIYQESGFNPNAYNESTMESGRVSRDRGMSQISDIWNPTVTDEQAYNPQFAIDFHAKRLADLYKQLGSWPLAVAAYNVGSGMVGVHPSRPTGLGPKGTKYVQGVAANLDPEFARSLQLLIGGE